MVTPISTVMILSTLTASLCLKLHIPFNPSEVDMNIAEQSLEYCRKSASRWARKYDRHYVVYFTEHHEVLYSEFN